MNKEQDVDSEDEQFDRSLSKEAARVVDELKFGVESADVSLVLENSDSTAYMNIRTLEKEDYCVELNANGYMIVSTKFDTIDADLKQKNLTLLNRYETIEALMHLISPLFVKKFNDSVAERLKQLA